ncbi:MAG: malate:quinone oxidoreductase, partial [Planctomycetota bacterium]
LKPNARIRLFEAHSEFAGEASNGWHNAGTGHAGLCELSYTPHRGADGEVDVSVAVKIFEQFEHSKQFWSSLVRDGVIDDPATFVRPVPHIAFVFGQEQVDFLRSRHRQMTKHHFFADMAYTEDRERIRQWAPLLLEGRDPNEPVAATKADDGTDVNFGSLARQQVEWLGRQDGCSSQVAHKVVGLGKQADGRWKVTVQPKNGERFSVFASFVFLGAGGGSLPLLQKANIAEAKGLGGFPIGGQWLVCDDPAVVEKHRAKVYGLSPGAAPTMAVPHLDLRIIDGKKALLFGPYAAWTTKFLHKTGRLFDLPGSVRLDNIASLVRVGLHNLPLVRYLIQQGLQSMNTRLVELRNFYPDAKADDWKLIDAGIRVQAIKKTDGDAGIVHFGTEVITDEANTISALLGASPGASVSANIMLDVIKRCFADELATPDGHERMKAMIPTFDDDLHDAVYSDRQRQTSDEAFATLRLTEAPADLAATA